MLLVLTVAHRFNDAVSIHVEIFKVGDVDDVGGIWICGYPSHLPLTVLTLDDKQMLMKGHSY